MEILLKIMRFVCVKTNVSTLNSCLSSIQIPKFICKLPVPFSVEDCILILSHYQYFIILYGARYNLSAISLIQTYRASSLFCTLFGSNDRKRMQVYMIPIYDLWVGGILMRFRNIKDRNIYNRVYVSFSLTFTCNPYLI